MAHHHHHYPEAGDRRLWLAIAVNLGLTIAQIVGGVLSGSLALIADALHNFSDAVALIIAFGARKIARRPADKGMTFGYGRAEVVAALVNYVTLIVIGLYLVYEAVLRFISPEGVDGWMVVWIASLALAVDLVTALLTYAMSKSSINIRAAFLHNVADALGSVAVIVAGVLILMLDWRLADPVVTLMIAGYILWQSFSEIGPAIRILMLGAPPETDAPEVLDALRAIDGVADVHHAHLWQMQEHAASLEAHLVIAEGAWDRAEAIKAAAKAVLETFGIAHSTLELERAGAACQDPPEYGHREETEPAHAGHAHA
jgi:cobalt-zinc-cadmium efflux system protein